MTMAPAAKEGEEGKISFPASSLSVDTLSVLGSYTGLLAPTQPKEKFSCI